MIRRHFGSGLATLALLATLFLFLFPLATGPFSVVHGPATALRSLRFWLQLLFALSAAFALVTALASARAISVADALSSVLHPVQPPAILRC